MYRKHFIILKSDLKIDLNKIKIDLCFSGFAEHHTNSGMFFLAVHHLSEAHWSHCAGPPVSRGGWCSHWLFSSCTVTKSTRAGKELLRLNYLTL